jgi:hypothetical protein
VRLRIALAVTKADVPTVDVTPTIGNGIGIGMGIGIERFQ